MWSHHPDYHSFDLLKKDFGSKQFLTNEEIQEIGQNYFEHGIEKGCDRIRKMFK